jgi:monoamine oxidase
MTVRTRTIDLENTSGAYYAPATVSSAREIIHVAGQPGTSKQGFLPKDYESQIHLALLNLHRILVAARASISDILKLTIYIVNYDPSKRLHTPIVQKFLRGHRPAITLVPVSALAVPGWLIEIDAVVARYPKSQSSTQIARPLSSVERVDVVVIGAGLAGLTAAEHVTKAGFSCVVLEARDRVGGRTWSHTLTSGGVIDIGAAWINDTNQYRMIGLARAFGAELITQNTTGDVVLQDTDGSLKHFTYGSLPSFSSDIQKHLGQIRDTVEADCQALACSRVDDARAAQLDSMTFKSYLESLGGSELAVQLGTVWSRAMLGQDSANISALFFLHYCKAGGGLLQMRSDGKGGGQYLRVRQGTQMFAKNLAQILPSNTVRLQSPVSEIQQSGDRVVVTCTSGNTTSISARKVICTVPTTTLRKIQFTPALSPAKQLLVDSYNYGYYQKVMAIFRSPFWTAKGLCGLVNSFTGPAGVIRDTSVAADGKYILTCFIAGSIGQAWSVLPTPEQREEAILKQIGEAFSDHETTRAEYVEMVGNQWNDDEWTGYGCPSPSTAPGVLSAVGGALRERTGNVHFAGTETSDEWRGYMEGAVRSGDREAAAVLKDLKGVSARL